MGKITITNDKGRLSKEDIDRMVNDAEKYKAEDEQQKDRISAKNGLESYIFNMKSSLGEEQIKSRLSGEEVNTITTALDETMGWLDRNQLAETEEFKSKQQELERLINPVMTRLHQGGQQQQQGDSCGRQEAQFGQNTAGPTIEEVD